MEYRLLGSTGFKVSAISFGAWAIGGSWGQVDDQQSMQTLHRALDLGINFFDTADVYGDGHSERLIKRLRQERPGETIYVATKAGRRLDPHIAAGYTRENLTGFVERSLVNLGGEALDLLQLHCPPNDVFYTPEVFQVLDDLKTAGKILHYGVSVEKVEEALKSLEYPGVESVQIIFNIFRQRPSEWFFQRAQDRQVGILARVPLASGLLTGKMSRQTTFEADDHRQFNRDGQAFDRGETFSGVDYETGLKAVDELCALLPAGTPLAQFALRWILMFPAVTCAIPGARRPAQVEENALAAGLPSHSEDVMQKTHQIYDRYIRALVHQRW